MERGVIWWNNVFLNDDIMIYNIAAIKAILETYVYFFYWLCGTISVHLGDTSERSLTLKTSSYSTLVLIEFQAETNLNTVLFERINSQMC